MGRRGSSLSPRGVWERSHASQPPRAEPVKCLKHNRYPRDHRARPEVQPSKRLRQKNFQVSFLACLRERATPSPTAPGQEPVAWAEGIAPPPVQATSASPGPCANRPEPVPPANAGRSEPSTPTPAPRVVSPGKAGGHAGRAPENGRGPRRGGARARRHDAPLRVLPGGVCARSLQGVRGAARASVAGRGRAEPGEIAGAVRRACPDGGSAARRLGAGAKVFTRGSACPQKVSGARGCRRAGP